MTISTPSNNIIAIILASGKGTRFGTPKAEAGYGGKSFAQHIQDSLQAAGINRVYFANKYESPDMLATLRLAVSDIMTGDASGYLIFPVDFPFVQPDTITCLINAHLDNPNAFIHPVFDKRRGHPIIIPSATNLWLDDENMGLREVLNKNKLSHIDVSVMDAGVIGNINTREDLAAWTQKN
ncbi:MAG: NTP transferase domain-containing protein [Candidatus Cloacimonetes bacterium]|nr:NTP transferase domain-containing protein [Candidatus Cloacimonadota bacterium]